MGSSAEFDRLALRIRAAARDGGLIETAQVKLIGLDEVRSAAGARWPRMREHVREGSLKIIASHIGPDDAVIPCGDGFLAVFANAAPEEMARACADINDALLKFYLGEDALKALKADVERKSVTADSLAGMVSKADQAQRTQRHQNQLQLGRFWPVWSARHRAIAAYLCAPALETKKATLRLAYAADFIERAQHRHRDYLDLDLCLLEQACSACEQNPTIPIGASVHATTLQNRRSRNIFLGHVDANASLFKERMFISVAEIEPGVPLISLAEWSNALKRRFTRVAFDLHHSDRALSAMGSTGIWAAGHHLPPGMSTSGVGLRHTLNQLHAWCRTLKQQGISPLFHGFEDNALLDLAAYTDLAFATSEALWPSMSAPGRTQHQGPALETLAAGASQC